MIFTKLGQHGNEMMTVGVNMVTNAILYCGLPPALSSVQDLFVHNSGMTARLLRQCICEIDSTVEFMLLGVYTCSVLVLH